MRQEHSNYTYIVNSAAFPLIAPTYGYGIIPDIAPYHPGVADGEPVDSEMPLKLAC